MEVCISGSIKFKKEIEKIAGILRKLNISFFLPSMELPKEMETAKMIPELVSAHLRKVGESEKLLVVDPGGYIGNSAKVEIGYAKVLGKKIYFLEKTGQPELDCLADSFVSFEEMGNLKDIQIFKRIQERAMEV